MSNPKTIRNLIKISVNLLYTNFKISLLSVLIIKFIFNLNYSYKWILNSFYGTCLLLEIINFNNYRNDYYITSYINISIYLIFELFKFNNSNEIMNIILDLTLILIFSFYDLYSKYISYNITVIWKEIFWIILNVCMYYLILVCNIDINITHMNLSIILILFNGINLSSIKILLKCLIIHGILLVFDLPILILNIIYYLFMIQLTYNFSKNNLYPHNDNFICEIYNLNKLLSSDSLSSLTKL